MRSTKPSADGRRRVARRILALTSLSILAVVTTACGSSSDDNNTSNDNAANNVAKADKDATLRVSTTYPPLSLDPITVASGVNPYQSLVYDRLINIDSHLNLVPMLATKWDFSADGMTLTLTLRDDVKFHTGTPMNADAVVASLNHWKTAEGSLLARNLQLITSMEAPDPTTVVLHLAQADASLPSILSSTAGTVLDPAAFAAGVDLTTDAGKFGSGPWVVKSYTLNQSATFVRADDPNWDTNAGLIKEIDLEWSTDQNARLNAMQTNAADMAYINNGETFQTDSMTSSGNFKLYKLPSGLQLSLILNQDRAPFDDPKVRQAIKEAIDPDPVVNGLFKGDCTSTEGSIFLPDTWAYSKATDKYPFDLDNAKKLLAQTDVANGFEFTAITNQGGANAQLATVIQDALSKVGITMKINSMPQQQMTPLMQARNYDAMVSVIASAVDPGLTVSQGFLTQGGTYAAGNEASELTDLAKQAISPSLSQDDRAKLYGQINQKIADEVWTVPVCNATTPWLATSKVQGVDAMNWVPNFDLRYLYLTD